MSRPKINSQLLNFEGRINEANALVLEIKEYKIIYQGVLKPIKVARIYNFMEMAFLEVFLSWEDFLESSFLRYMCGAVTDSGYKPKRYVSPPTLDHAHKILLMAGKKYSDWTNAQEIIQRSETVFEQGEPFASAMRPSVRDLENIRVIRNAIAHRSGSSWNQFIEIVGRELGYRPKGVNPGMFLMRTEKRTSLTYFEYFRQILGATSKSIVK